MPAPEIENIEGYDKVLSKPIRDRLNQFGVPVLYAHPRFVVPTYAAWDNPEHESTHPYLFGDRTIFVIEDKAIQERIDNPDFLQFFKAAAAKHATFVATGDTSLNSLRQLIERAEIQAPTIYMHHGNPQVFAFKITEKKDASGAGIDISEMASLIHELNAIPPIDQALFIIEFSRGQTELAKNLILQRTPP